MKKYTKGEETKKELISLTYLKLKKQRVSEITLRSICEAKGCSSPAIYRYFESLDELIMIASMHFMSEYMQAYAKLLDQELDSFELCLMGRKLYNEYAFARPDIFYNFFYGPYNHKFESLMEEYYELFPFSGSTKFPAFYFIMQFNGNLIERDYQEIYLMVKDGLITEGEAKYYTRILYLMSRSLLMECIDKDEDYCQRCKEECNYLHETTLAPIGLRRRIV